MAGLIPQSFIDDLLNRTDIVDVVSSRVQLKKTGKNYSACCPFHKEKTPSFTVSPDKQFYYCFGCGAGGNALGFIIDYDQMDFPEAVEELAKRHGLEVPHEEAGRQRQPRQAKDSPLYPILASANEFYRQALKEHQDRQAAVSYLKNRGVSGAIARDYDLGFAPPGWDNLYRHLAGDDLQLKTMLEAGLLVENTESGKRYDRFRDRIMFPIKDARGRVIAFGGRILGDGKPKYLNSPETPVFHKIQELYGLYEARQHHRDLQEVIVVEGYMDVIALAQHGLRNAVATLGTATSEDHIKRLFRLVPSILFCFDGDAAGRNAAWRALGSALSQLKDGLRIRFLFLPEGEDPDSLIRHEGSEAFLARMTQHAQPLADYFFDHLIEKTDLSTLEGRAYLATLATPLLNDIPGNNLRALMLKRLEELTGLDQKILQQTSQTGSKLHTGFEPLNEKQPTGMHFTSENQVVHRHDITGVSSHKTQIRSQNRPARAVETPELTALRTLLHRPELAQKVPNVASRISENAPYVQLLISLIETLQKNPRLTAMQLIARWHGTDHGHLLQSLAEKEWLIEDDNLEQQFFDTITDLARKHSHRLREQELQEILRKNPGELTAEEKTLLREHFQMRNHDQ